MKYVSKASTVAELRAYNEKNMQDFFGYQISGITNTVDQAESYENTILFDDTYNLNANDPKYDEKDIIYYNMNRYQRKYGETTKYSFGDICYIDRNNNLFVTNELIDVEYGYTPIAVCAIPSDFYHAKSPARFVSCYGYVYINVYNPNTAPNKIYSYALSRYGKECSGTFIDNYLGNKYQYLSYYVSSNRKIDEQADTILTDVSNNYFVSNNTTYDILYPISLNEIIAGDNYSGAGLRSYSNFKIILGHDYSDTYNFNDMYNYGDIITSDIFGYENTYYYTTYNGYGSNSGIIIKNYETDFAGKIVGYEALKNKIYWYMPAISELMFLRIHIGEIHDICFQIQKKYELYEFDMFQNTVDAYSSTIYTYPDGDPTGAEITNGEIIINDAELPKMFVMSKNGNILKYEIPANKTNIATYPMFQM